MIPVLKERTGSADHDGIGFAVHEGKQDFSSLILGKGVGDDDDASWRNIGGRGIGLCVDETAL